MRFPRLPVAGQSPSRAGMLASRAPLVLALALMLALTGFAGRGLAQEAPIRLKVAGGLAELSQYVRYEQPFWTRRVPELTGGRVRAEIAPFDRSGIRGQEMLQLMRLGVVPFGDVLLAVAAAEEPELNAIDLPVLNPDMAALRRIVELWRPRLESLLRERYGVELLAIYTYPAQVVFCRHPFSGLADLAGRRVRTSSVGQSELVGGLGGTPVVIPFAETVAAMRGGVVECAITGALSGNAVGLHEVATHISRLAISWGVSIFGANTAAWEALPEEIRGRLRAGLLELQEEIWQAAEHETEDGLACNAGRPDCTEGRPGRMIVIEERWQDEARRLQLLRDVVLPGWVQRCGPDCAATWNRFIAPSLGLWTRAE
jgi:TRAP-type C4-dicarboxylate transport system substrate-binding protein